jgi:lactam utilization protein B
MSNLKMSKDELESVLHWRGKHAQVVKERDALHSDMTKRDEQIDHLSVALSELDSALRVVAVAGAKTSLSSLRALAKRSLNIAHGVLSDQSAPAAKGEL